MSVVFEKRLAPPVSGPDAPPGVARERCLDIVVVFTSAELTIHALRTAAALADKLNGRITLVVPQVVPYPLPLETPPVLSEFNQRRFQSIVAANSVDTSVRVFLCRSKIELLTAVLKPSSLVVVGARRSWRSTAEKRLAAKLKRAGHMLILAETK